MQKNRLSTLLIAASLVLALGLPAMAAAGGTGGGVLNVQTQQVQKPDDVTYVTRSVIDNYLAKISGIGEVWYGNRSRLIKRFFREAIVSQSELAQGIASVLGGLESDVGSIAGRTWQYEAPRNKDFGYGGRQKFIEVPVRHTGSEKVLTGSETEREYTGTTVESSQTTTSSGDAILIGDPDAIENAYVAQGTVEQTTTIEKTDHYTQTTTEHYDEVDYYQINVTRLISPLVLDLDGDGVLQASSGRWLPHEELDRSRLRLFDFHGNGFPVAMEWVGPNDGLLCVPKEDGTVDGTCLFGTANGFESGYEALAVRDENGDQRISGAELAGLMVWQDRNGNAVVDAGELQAVEDLGITSINLRHDNFVGSFERNGKTYRMWDWWPNALELRRKKLAIPR